MGLLDAFKKRRDLAWPLMADAWKELDEHKDILRPMIAQAFDKRLKGKRLSMELEELGSGRVRYLIKKTIVGPPKEDMAEQKLAYDLSFEIEDITLGGAAILVFEPVMHDNRIIYQLAIGKGPNRSAPDFPPNVFYAANMFSLPDEAATYLSESPFTISKRAFEPWESLLANKDALKALIIEMLVHRLKGRRLKAEIVTGGRVRYLIDGASIPRLLQDDKKHTLTYIISISVEGFTLAEAVVMTVELIAGGNFKYLAKVMRGPNKDAPSFPPVAFPSNNVYEFADMLAKYLSESQFFLY